MIYSALEHRGIVVMLKGSHGNNQPFSRSIFLADKMPEISLTHQDRQFLLDQVPELDEPLLQALAMGFAQNGMLHLRLSVEELEGLCDALFEACQAAPSRKIRRALERLLNKFASHLSNIESDNSLAPPLSRLPAWMRDEVERLLQTESSGNIEEINRRLAEISDEHNRRPMAEFDGLSPNQVSRLLDANWESEDSAVALNQRIPASELAEIEIFANARLMLQTLIDAGGTKATTAGNLNRRFVEEMAHRVLGLETFVKNMRQWNKVINEEDFYPICVLRHVMQFGGLIRRTKGMFQATKKAEKLMVEEKAGEMYGLLFQSFFQKYNLAALDGMPECSALQDTIAYSFFMISKHAGNWITPKDLARYAILPAVSAELPSRSYSSEPFDADMLTTRVIRPLLRFGLLDCQYDETKEILFYGTPKLVRKTPLFKAFLSFRLND